MFREPDIPLYSSIAQSVEHAAVNRAVVVEYRLAKARVAGSNPVSRSFYLTQESCNSKVSCVFCIEGGDLCTGRAGYRLDSQMSAINI